MSFCHALPVMSHAFLYTHYHQTSFFLQHNNVDELSPWTNSSSSSERALQESPVRCQLLQLHGLPADDVGDTAPADFWVCQDEQHRQYRINLKSLMTASDTSIISGATTISISKAVKPTTGAASSAGELRIPADAIIQISTDDETTSSNHNDKSTSSGGNGRRTMGARTALVVRVTSQDGYVTRSASHLARDVFTDNLNLATQMRACSNGAITFEPTRLVEKGVLSIHLDDRETNNVDWLSVVEWAQPLVKQKIQQLLADNNIDQHWWNVADHTLYVLPHNADFLGAAAWGSVGGQYTYYRDLYASLVGVQMHEIGAFCCGAQYSIASLTLCYWQAIILA